MKFSLTLMILCALFLFSSNTGACPNSPDDETIIEYFNEIEFSEDIYVIIIDNGIEFTLMLDCPPQQSPYFPPTDFHLEMFTSNNSQSASCNTGSIVINKTQLHSNSLSYCSNGEVCSFLVILTNLSTQAIYSQTEILITMTNGNDTYIPNLNPATIPICGNRINECLIEGTCTFDTSEDGELSLCTSPTITTCASPPSTYSYNENIYFQTSITSQP